jgi:hypothetical protein
VHACHVTHLERAHGQGDCLVLAVRVDAAESAAREGKGCNATAIWYRRASLRRLIGFKLLAALEVRGRGPAG